MRYERIGTEINEKLRLATPPIALAFVERAPAGIPSLDEDVPSACSFWRKAEMAVFYASADRHFNCPIGALTMGFAMPDEVQAKLMELTKMMCGVGYLAPEEAAKIPSIPKKHSGIVYGPLRDFPIEPDLVLMWLTPDQAMLYAEAAGSCRWVEERPIPLLGRPSCAALPVALANSQSTFSLGCTGMRIFTGIGEDRFLAVLPGNRMLEFNKALGSKREATQRMRIFYEDHKKKFPAETAKVAPGS